ncbi:MAG: ABC transporter permease [Prevotella sp.]|nr:ABC transporter permease [Candidatus Prevotella equi]
MKALIAREIRLLLHHPIYVICMVVLPLFITVFFTSIMNSGQPVNMPIGVIDNDNTSTTRKLTRLIDAFQSAEVVEHYNNIADARKAVQRNEIYGFILFPEGMTQKMISGRQPRMSVYFSNATLLAGSLLYKEMKTMCTLGNAAVGQATMTARGATPQQTMAFLQPIKLDTHNIGNPWVSYNIYLSVMLIPTCIMLFIFLLTAYSLGAEQKFGTYKQWLEMADGNMLKALYSKLIPQACVHLIILYACFLYIFGILHFPAPGGIGRLMLLGLLVVIAAQGFGVFLYGAIPSMRMSMSICSLWGVLNFSMVGTAFPIFAMDAPLQTLSWLFPMRHYYLIYQLCIFNTYPLANVMTSIIALICFALLPLLVVRRMKKTYNNFEYIP